MTWIINVTMQRWLFKPKIILQRSLNMYFQWFSVTMVYYGLLLICIYKSFWSILISIHFFSSGPSRTFQAIFCIIYLPQIFWSTCYCLIAMQMTCSICCIAGGLVIDVESLSTFNIILVCKE